MRSEKEGGATPLYLCRVLSMILITAAASWPAAVQLGELQRRAGAHDHGVERNRRFSAGVALREQEKADGHAVAAHSTRIDASNPKCQAIPKLLVHLLTAAPAHRRRTGTERREGLTRLVTPKRGDQPFDQVPNRRRIPYVPSS